MCEIFPVVDDCCLVFSYRIGLLFISVFAVITGAVMLSIVEKRTNLDSKSWKNLSSIEKPSDGNQALSRLALLIPTAISGMSVLFMLMGMLLLYATLSGEEGFVQVFVWVTFLNIILGFILVLAISVECMMTKSCLVSGMGWLFSSTVLIFLVICLFLWLYFIIVGNSYVLNGD